MSQSATNLGGHDDGAMAGFKGFLEALLQQRKYFRFFDVIQDAFPMDASMTIPQKII
jgi:hypothetical protein